MHWDIIRSQRKTLVRLLAVAGALVVALVVASPAKTAGTFPPRADDTFPSLGTFRLWIAPPYRFLFAGCGFYNPATFRIQSPDLFDPATVVGRSDPMTEGSAPDTAGATVGTAGTMVKDANLPVAPPWFDSLPGPIREVHTEVRSLNLTPGGGGMPPYVRGGIAGPVLMPPPLSPGEVESQDLTGNPANDFPARSFFDVFVEVNLPVGLCPAPTAPIVIHNTAALLVRNDSLPMFPPKVIYIHGNSTAVPVYFETTNPGQWTSGALLGFLVLAGHGAGFNIAIPTDVAQFDLFMQAQPEMPLPSLCSPGDPDCDGDVDFLDPGHGLPCAQDHQGDANGDGYSDADELTPVGPPSCTGAFPPSGGLGLSGLSSPSINAPCPGRPPGSPAARTARADVDLDGQISIIDLSIVAAHFLESANPADATDIRWEFDQDGDGQMTIIDLSIMAGMFLQSVRPC
jgi:hypothetical protein